MCLLENFLEKKKYLGFYWEYVWVYLLYSFLWFIENGFIGSENEYFQNDWTENFENYFIF